MIFRRGEINVIKKFACFLAVVLCLIACGCSNKSVDVGSSGEDDLQPYWNMFNQPVAAAENGYYYIYQRNIQDGVYMKNLIAYMDGQTKSTTILCNKPECRHEDENCDAALGDEYNSQSIYYYKGYIYVIKNDESDGNSYLVQIKPDGSERKTLFELGTISVAYKLAFGGDSVYCYNRVGGYGVDETQETVRRRSLDGKDDNIIFSYTAKGAQVSAVKLYGNKAFILVTSWTKNSNSADVSAQGKGVYIYDTDTQKTELFIDKSVSDFTVDENEGNIYYFVIDDGLYEQKLSTGSRTKLLECEDRVNNYCELSYDGQYLYMCNEMYKNMIYKTDSYVWVVKKDGEIVNKIETAGTYCTFFGDDKYIFGTNKDKEILTISKAEISKAKEWEKLENPLILEN